MSTHYSAQKLRVAWCITPCETHLDGGAAREAQRHQAGDRLLVLRRHLDLHHAAAATAAREAAHHGLNVVRGCVACKRCVQACGCGCGCAYTGRNFVSPPHAHAHGVQQTCSISGLIPSCAMASGDCSISCTSGDCINCLTTARTRDGATSRR